MTNTTNTAKARIQSAIKNTDWETINDHPADLDALLALAYEMGREDATRAVSDDYTALIAAMRKRANASRCWRAANKIIGDADHLHHSDYRGDMTALADSITTDL